MVQKKVLMVCLGNICRSPIAEAVFKDQIQKFGKTKEWYVDSAGIEGWHSGDNPDDRVLSVLKNHGIQYRGIARQLTNEDFYQFDYIFGMEEMNTAEIKRIAPKDSNAKILLLGDFGLKADEKTIQDPYYLVGEAPFEKVYEQCLTACLAFLNDFDENKI